MKSVWAAAAAMLASTTGAHAATAFTQDFTSSTAGFTGGTYATTVSGEKYLQLANSESTTLITDNVNYTNRTITFNLYGIQSVDGNGPDGGGADNFYIYLNGSSTPIYTINLANYNSGTNTQNYNGNLATSGPGYSYAPFTGSIARGTLGYGTGPFGDSTYSVTFTLSDLVTSLRFVGATNEGRTDSTGTSTNGNEAYGIDNVLITGTALVTGVPEPASWAMMILGCGAVGLAMRSRRRAATALA